MNKYELYRNAFGTCPVWQEGYQKDGVTISLEAYNQLSIDQKKGRSLIYTNDILKEYWNEWEKLPSFLEITKNIGGELVGCILGRSANYPQFVEKIQLEVFECLQSTIDNLENTNYLAELFVDPTKQGQGVGKKLIEEYIQEVFDTGATGILTRTTMLKDNPKKLFERSGFKQIKSYDDEKQIAIFYLAKT